MVGERALASHFGDQEYSSMLSTPIPFPISGLILEVLENPPSMLSKLTFSQLVFLGNSLKQPKSLKLLFRASSHEFKAAKFHQYCDDMENTLTIVKTD
jgi:hypothetical protein